MAADTPSPTPPTQLQRYLFSGSEIEVEDADSHLYQYDFDWSAPMVKWSDVGSLLSALRGEVADERMRTEHWHRVAGNIEAERDALRAQLGEARELLQEAYEQGMWWRSPRICAWVDDHTTQPKAEQEPATQARCGGTGRLDFGSMGDDCPGCADCTTTGEGRGRK